MFGHDALGYAQPQARSLPFGLGGEEGVENRWQDVAGNSLAIVDDFDGNVVGFFMGESDDLNFTAFGGGVHRVENEIDDDVMEL